jgi:hypothetical protein
MRQVSVVTALALASVAALGVSGPVAAAGWKDPIVLSQVVSDKVVDIGDIAARGGQVVVGWNEDPPSGNRASYVRWSTNGGNSFAPRIRLDTRPQREVQVDVCSGWAWAASGLNADGDWLVALDKRRLFGNEVEQSVLTTDGVSRYPDVACGGERLVVAWFQRVGGQWRVKLHARGVHDEALGDSLPPFDADLGPGTLRGGLAVAATADRVYVAWFRGSALKVRRYRIGSGSNHQLTHLGTSTLANNGGSTPRLGADGDRVAIAYGGGDARARVSTDQGSSWGPWRTLAEGAFEIINYPGSVDVRGSRVIVAVVSESVGFGTSWIERSTNNGQSWSEVPGSARQNGRMVGALAAPGGTTKVVQAWDQALSFPEFQRVRFRRQS